MITAKKVNSELQPINENYELFIEVDMLGVNGETVKVLQSIGQYSLSQLESEKAMLQSHIADIDTKIAVITALEA